MEKLRNKIRKIKMKTSLIMMKQIKRVTQQ